MQRRAGPLRQPVNYSVPMSVTVNLTLDEVTKIKQFTALASESDAVTKAAREFLRVSELQELKASSGKLDYQEVGDAMEALELREQCKK